LSLGILPAVNLEIKIFSYMQLLDWRLLAPG
jgi:hypothetical protein